MTPNRASAAGNKLAAIQAHEAAKSAQQLYAE
jgi:hypothetical protein